jgi:hypothetical protein
LLGLLLKPCLVNIQLEHSWRGLHSCDKHIITFCCLWPCFLSSLYAWTKWLLQWNPYCLRRFQREWSFFFTHGWSSWNECLSSGMGEKHYMDKIDEIPQ